jgi:hypothetical protein
MNGQLANGSDFPLFFASPYRKGILLEQRLLMLRYQAG